MSSPQMTAEVKHSVSPSIIPKLLENICEAKSPNEKSNLYIFKPENHKITDAIFLRSDVTFQSLIQNSISLSLTWLTISQCHIHFINVVFECKIQVTATATLTAQNCTFTPIQIGSEPNEKCECAVEIFANSRGEFENCTFHEATKTAIAIRDRSLVTFKKCKFHNNYNTSILVLDNSRANINDCTFELDSLEQPSRFSLYLYRSSQAKIERSHFQTQLGKAIFMLTNSTAHVYNCDFENCKGGAISIADNSFIYTESCTFKKIGSSSIHAMRNSTAQARDCKFNDCQGNGVNYEYSSGYVLKCKFHEFDFPAIACFGPVALPIIHDVVIDKCKTIAVVSRDCSAPIFSNFTISNVKSHGFSISDFSKCIISNGSLTNVDGAPFCAFNGAFPVIENTFIQRHYDSGNKYSTILFEIFTKAKINFNNNKIQCDTNNVSLDIHHYGGVIKEFENNCLTYDELDTATKLVSQKTVGLIIGDDQQLQTNIIESQPESQPIQSPESVEHVKLITPSSDNATELQHQQSKTESEPPKSVQPKTFPLLRPAGNRSFTFSTLAKKPEPLPRLDIPREIQEIKNLFPSHHAANLQAISQELESELPPVKKNENENEDNETDAATEGKANCGPCMLCNNDIANYVCAPCGHKVLCKSCAEKCAPPETTSPQPNQQPQPVSNSSREKCPLCKTPIQRCCEEFVESVCVICLDNACDTIILPCGHCCICYECANQLCSEKKKCPLCQARVLSFRHQFPIYNDQEIEQAKRFIQQTDDDKPKDQ